MNLKLNQKLIPNQLKEDMNTLVKCVNDNQLHFDSHNISFSK